MNKLPPKLHRDARRFGMGIAVLLLTFLLTVPAGATSRLFTVDFDGDKVNELDGSDDVPISFLGSTGNVDGVIRAVDITGVNRAALTAEIASLSNFSGFPGAGDFDQTDTLIFDIVLNGGSAPIDEFSVAVATNPTALDPDGAGFLNPCDPGVPLGCRANVPAGQTPDSISLISGQLPFPFPSIPGGVLFGFNTNNLDGGETSVRMFVTWADTGLQSPLHNSQIATFMISSGTNGPNILTNIIPEPTTGLMVGLGLLMLSATRKRRAS